MKFQVRQNEIKRALEIIKDSKALGKSSDEDDTSFIRVKVKDQKISFMSSNVSVWAESFLEDVDGLVIEQDGQVFVDGSDFINIIYQMPKDSIINFSFLENEGQNMLIAESKDPSKKGRTRTSKFLIYAPSHFNENPPKEDRKVIQVSAKKLNDAINSVEFATSSDEQKQYLWGIQTEIYGEQELAACASDRLRIAWWDEKGYDRSDVSNVIRVNPIKSSFLAAMKHMDSEELVAMEIGEKYTVLRQKDQWQAIPNAAECGQGENLPEWRSITDKMNKSCKSTIKIPREVILDFIKSATSAQGAKYGITVKFDTANKNVKFCMNEAKSGGSLKSTHEIEEELEQNQIEGEDLVGEITLMVEGLKEIANKYKGQYISIKLIDCHNSVQIVDEDSSFRYISSILR